MGSSPVGSPAPLYHKKLSSLACEIKKPGCEGNGPLHQWTIVQLQPRPDPANGEPPQKLPTTGSQDLPGTLVLTREG